MKFIIVIYGIGRVRQGNVLIVIVRLIQGRFGDLSLCFNDENELVYSGIWLYRKDYMLWRNDPRVAYSQGEPFIYIKLVFGLAS